MILRQSTAKTISFGPFLDKTDGVALETGLVSAIDHATTGILLSKNGGALTIRSQAVTASTYDAYGNYIVTLSTTDTNTVGTLRVQFSEAATCLPVWQDFQIVEEAVYDALYAASAPGYLQPATAGRTLVVDANGLADANMVKSGPTGSGTAQTAGDIYAQIGAAGAGLTAINAALLDYADGVELGVTLRQAIRLILSAAAGKTNGFVPGSDGMGRIRDIGDSKDRIVATYDGNGNRTSITTDVS